MVSTYDKLSIIIVGIIISAAFGFVFLISEYDLKLQLEDNTEQSVSETNNIEQYISKANNTEQSVSKANNILAINLYKMLESDGNKNIFFSPTSIFVGMMMAYEGTRNNTALQMEDALDISSDDNSRRNEIIDLVESLTNPNSDYDLDIKNSLWVRDSFPILPEYTDTMAVHYNNTVGSFNAQSSDKINKWMNDSTRGKIPKIVNYTTLSDPDLNFMIVNTIFFYGSWMDEFIAEDRIGYVDFWINNVESVKTNVMVRAGGAQYRQFENVQYRQIDNVQILKLPYKSDPQRLSMVIVLPEERYGIAKLEERLTAEIFVAWIDSTELQNSIQVIIPTFKLDTEYSGSLISSLKKLGITDAFDKKNSNMLNMSPAPELSIDDMIHRAFLNVHEKGTVPADPPAAMEDVLRFSSIIFKADHPFIFAIWDDQTETILFMGRISDPTA